MEQVEHVCWLLNVSNLVTLHANVSYKLYINKYFVLKNSPWGKNHCPELGGISVTSRSVSRMNNFSPLRKCISSPFTSLWNIVLKSGMLARILVSRSVTKLSAMLSGSFPNGLNSVRFPPDSWYHWTASSVRGICAELSAWSVYLVLIRWLGTPLPVQSYKCLMWICIICSNAYRTYIPGIRCSFQDLTASDVPGLATCRVKLEMQNLWLSGSISKSPLSSMSTKQALMG